MPAVTTFRSLRIRRPNIRKGLATVLPVRAQLGFEPRHVEEVGECFEMPAPRHHGQIAEHRADVAGGFGPVAAGRGDGRNRPTISGLGHRITLG